MYNVILSMYTNVKYCIVQMYITLTSMIISDVIWVPDKVKSPTYSFFTLSERLANHSRKCKIIKTTSNCHNDNLDIFLKLFILLYADDNVLMAKSATVLKEILNAFNT